MLYSSYKVIERSQGVSVVVSFELGAMVAFGTAIYGGFIQLQCLLSLSIKKQLQRHTAGKVQYLWDTEDVIQKASAQVQGDSHSLCSTLGITFLTTAIQTYFKCSWCLCSKFSSSVCLKPELHPHINHPSTLFKFFSSVFAAEFCDLQCRYCS